jgi:hypothetical protein
MAIETSYQETSFCRYRDEKRWEVWTSDKTFITLMRKQGYKPMSDSQGGYNHYEIPLNRVTIRKAAPRKRRKIKEGTRVKLAKNLEKARAARAAKKAK